MARFGSLDTQYFDDAGDPLVSGKIYFYETGTTTPKNTYADPSYAIPNANPVILTAAGRQPNIFFPGAAKAILAKSDDTQILVRDPVGETESSFGDAWIASKDYNANAVVQGSDGQFYVSLINGNVNNNPVTTSGSWTFLYSVEWNAGTTYKLGSVVTYQTVVYQSLQNANLNQNPSTITAFWVPIQLVWSATSTYALNANVVGTNGVLYTSIQAANTGNVPASSPLWWAGTSAAAAASAAAASVSQSAALASQNAAAASQASATASQLSASNSAAAAAASAAASEAASNAAGWVSGQAYLAGDVVWSPISFLSYRAKVNTSGTTDPSLSANWELLNAGGITNVVTATTATTLTNTKTLLQITPASYGVVVTLPDATTMSEGGPVHCIDNRGTFPVIVKNTSGTLLGFVPVKIASFISLDDNATADGVWGFSAIDAIAPTALIETAVFTAGLTTVSAGGRASVDMGGGIEIVLGTRSSDGHLYAIAHNYSTGVSGTPTAIRAANVDGTVRAAHVRHSATQLLVVSCGNGNTNLEAVIVTLNTGTLALTPNTAATATLSANITAMADGCGLLAVPSLPDSFVLTYTLATPAAQMRAISVSGTTVTIGSASSLDGTTGALTVTTGAIAIAVSSDGATYYAKPYTVSGSSLSAGTGFTDGAYSSVTINKLFPLGSRWVCLFNSNGASGSVIGSILTLSGTVVTDTTATVFGGTASLVDAGVVNGKVIVMNNAGSSNFNLLTDTAGTASVGTAISVGSGGRFWYASGSIAYASSTTSGVAIDCSGASPVLSRTLNSVLSASSSNSVLSLAGVMISVSGGVLQPTSPTPAAGVVAIGIRAGGLFTELPSWTFTPTTYRGFTDKQRWGYNNANLLGKLEAV